ncbi:MAG: ATP-binding protein [Polyangiaceae bacterium]|nr:ATP-binding protein [Polyangiaceae bacterium]
MNLVHITDRSDVLVAQQVAKRIAHSVGFDRSACAELMIVASELASNILKYGQRGVLRAEPVDDAERGVGIRIVAEDEGPPFKSFETALRDGFDDEGPVQATAFVTRRGTASGLGAVSRLSDELRMLPLEKGKAVVATRYVTPAGRRRSIRS